MVVRTYEFCFWCRTCGKWILKENAEKDRLGYPICPVCHRRVRIKPRHNKFRKHYQNKEGEENNE